MSKIFVQIPHNKPSGGVKVANQLASLFINKGYEAWVVLPKESKESATWLSSPPPAITIEEMLNTCKKEDIIIDNWPHVDHIKASSKAPARVKVFYLQGCSFPKSKELVGDRVVKDFEYTHYWSVSQSSKKYVEANYNPNRPISIVHPYFNTETHKKYASMRKKYKRQGVLCLARKGRRYIDYIFDRFHNDVDFTIIDRKFTEDEFFEYLLHHKYFLATAVGIDTNLKTRIKHIISKGKSPIWIVPKEHYEGFPIPNAEAAVCGCPLVGFAMGGGLEWMNKKNSFLAEDRNYKSLRKMFELALNADEGTLEAISDNAFRSISKFTDEHSWKQIYHSIGEHL